MDSQSVRFSSIDEYIAACPPETHALLEQMRATIHAAAPDAQETISYAMPAFAQHGILVYFAAMKNHIGLYPTSSGIAAFQQELAGYISSKGAVRFPFDQPLPVELISRIVSFRVEESLAKAAAKPAAKPRKGKA